MFPVAQEASRPRRWRDGVVTQPEPSDARRKQAARALPYKRNGIVVRGKQIFKYKKYVV